MQTAAEVLMGLHCVEDDEGPGRPDLGDDGGDRAAWGMGWEDSGGGSGMF